MSFSRPNTVGVVNNLNQDDDDDDDNDICPVCDGECTCNNNKPPRPIGPISMNEYATQYAPSTSTPHHYPTTSSHSSSKPTLKIKLTVPQSLLAKRRATLLSSSSTPCSTEGVDDNNDDDDDDDQGIASASVSSAPPKQPVSLPKRRGRPPKVPVRSFAANRQMQLVQSDAPLSPQSNPPLKCKNVFLKQKRAPPRARLTKDKQAAAVAAAAISQKAAAAAKKRKRTDHGQVSDATDAYDDDDDNDDTASGKFPTFVSASALSSLSSSESDSSPSGFDTDSSIEAEEEKFILTEVRDKARIRRELLGDEGQKKRDYYNNWVIRPRKRSVGPSDAEMDIDSEATEDDDDEQDDDDDDDDDDEDGEGEETDGRCVGRDYIGLATGWSDDDESSFDADLFFANLSDTDSWSGSSTPDTGEVGDHSDMDSASLTETTATDLLPHLRQGMENLPFEVTEGWDGQIVFTNGLDDGRGVLDIDFEIDAAQFMAGSSTPPSRADSDVDMSATDVEDGGHEEDADGGGGDTTDEELVGKDYLPNERAMRLFSLPFNVSAINPMSTVSPVAGPAIRHCSEFRPLDNLGSPRPADILAGKVYWDSDEPEDMDYLSSSQQSRSTSRGTGPRRGSFVPNTGTRKAIIDDTHKEVPSPHPNFRGRRKSAGRSYNPVSYLRQQLPTSTLEALSDVVYNCSSPFESSDSLTHSTPSAKPIDLNDVLEASFLDPDPTDPPGSSSAASDSDSHDNAKTLNRWNTIPVSAFRQTREVSSSMDYRKMMKASPTSTMLWQNKSNAAAGPSSTRSRNRCNTNFMNISPIILPRDRDGDRTPTNSHTHVHTPNGLHDLHQHQPFKSRKELRRERKLKRQSFGPAHHPYHNHQPQHQHQHHQHRHYPNAKSRSSASLQRTSFLNSSVPPLNL
ncbi:hypothetical protein AMATHDRAFT_60095 [Amanita thiersii Skay4041]|uniref:Uncharacterized protein n=1 Tax=Amanita thiersii Skay4041 TaxID=703135 RepID=A0A2A9NJ86_9AGAR|nr:hypothetical protein AMATHDRAFT_60095 [Amanita thiersii Skay4041]